MARDTWFETVGFAQQRAKKRLPKSVYSALLGASEKGVTVADNVEAFAELGFAPHVIGATEKRDLATTVMGQDISMPVVISPTGVQAVHPDGEVAVARAAAARGTAMGLSSFASKPIEEVIAANPKIFFQVYWLGGRDAIAARVERAREAGAVGLIVTTDWSFSHGRDWGSPKIPEQMNLRTTVRMMPEGLTRPRWLWQWARPCVRRTCGCPTRRRAASPGPPFFAAYGEWMGTPPPTWEDIAWLRELWGGPFMLKGVMRVDDAKRAVDAGVSAISVSNHGGNNLDGTPASIRALPAIADAVGDEVEVLLDGGVRRGSDVVKARGPRRPRGDDRPGLPVGPGGQRPGRRRERARRPARRHRLGVDGSWSRVGPRLGCRATSSSRRASPGRSACPATRRLTRDRRPRRTALVQAWRRGLA